MVGDMVQREFPELRNLIKVRRLPLGDRAEQTNVVFPESVSSTSPALHHASQAIRHQRAGAGTACDVSLNYPFTPLTPPVLGGGVSTGGDAAHISYTLAASAHAIHTASPDR